MLVLCCQNKKDLLTSLSWHVYSISLRTDCLNEKMFKSKNLIDIFRRSQSVFELQLRWASYTNRESKMLAKLMTGKRRPFFKWEDTTTPKRPSILEETSTKRPSKITARRAVVLNKMFMLHVTEIMANGPTGLELSQLGLVITQVKVCQHYHGLNIFWTATATDDFDMVEQKLESIKKSVRHQLHQMQLMGNIPHITFVRDYQLSYMDELQAVISKADYGDDYEPGPKKRQNEKSDFDVHGENIDQQTSEEGVDRSSSMPPMRYDVFGVDHARIMGRIKQSMTKSKQAWIAYDKRMSSETTSVKPFTLSTSFESIRQEHETAKNSEQLLKEFLVKRKQLRKQNRSEQMDANKTLLMEEMMRHEYNEHDDSLDIDQDQIHDENEIEKFYEEYEPIDE